MKNDSKKDADSARHAGLWHTCRSVKDLTLTLNGVTLEGADVVMFTPPVMERAPSEDRDEPVLNTSGAILSSDDAFNRAFEWQTAQKHTDKPHMKADISIAGVFNCKATSDTARWTLHDVHITNVNRNVDLLEPGTDMYQFEAVASKE